MASPLGALTFWTANTRTVFSIAVGAANGISAPPRVGGQRQAFVSFVFAVSALEAFLNESTYVASSCRKDALAGAFARVMEGAEESRAQLQSKFHFASLVLTGKAYDTSRAPFQDFSLLVE